MFAQGRIAACPLTSCPAASPLRLLALLLAAAALLLSQPARAENSGAFEALFAQVSESEDGSGFVLDGQFSITLSSGAREALENGIPLVFELQVQLVKSHRWIWDRVAVEMKMTRLIQYHDLSRSYVVKDLESGMQSNYRRLEDALGVAGTIEALQFGDRNKISDVAGYKIRLRGSLDIESLPTPVRLIAYVSSVWNMSSEWYVWSLDR